MASKDRHDISLRGSTHAALKAHAAEQGSTIGAVLEEWIAEALDAHALDRAALANRDPYIAPAPLPRAEDCPSLTPGAWKGGE